MAKTITIGKQGDQPFTISQEGVSRHHARLTIEDDDRWLLEDLDSSNGTFIRNEDGDLEQVSRKYITEATYICLGPDNSNGCRFYARQLVAPGDFQKDFDYLEDLDSEIEENLDNAEDKSKLVRKAIALISTAGLIGSFIVTDDSARTLLLRISTGATAASTMFYDPSKQKKSLKTLREKMFGCPNPACSNTLKSKDVKNRKCPKCGAKG